MQQTIPYRSTHLPTTSMQQFNPIRPSSAAARAAINARRKDDVRRMVKENAVIVFARSGCCMTYVVKRLLQGLGVNPAVYEVGDAFEDVVSGEIRAAGGVVQLPAVFIGGRWFGGLDRIMATHIMGELTPLLKQAGALWL